MFPLRLALLEDVAARTRADFSDDTQVGAVHFGRIRPGPNESIPTVFGAISNSRQSLCWLSGCLYPLIL